MIDALNITIENTLAFIAEDNAYEKSKYDKVTNAKLIWTYDA